MTREPGDRWPMARVRDFLQSGPRRWRRRGIGPGPDPGAVRGPGRRGHLHGHHRVHPGAPTGRTRTRAGRCHDPWARPAAVGPVDRRPRPAARPRAGGLGRPGRRRRARRSRRHTRRPRARAAPARRPPPRRPTAPPRPAWRPSSGDYLATVTTDPASAFAMLTPGFQQASGGIKGYRGFWDTIRTADLVSFSTADPATPHRRLHRRLHAPGRQHRPGRRLPPARLPGRRLPDRRRGLTLCRPSTPLSLGREDTYGAGRAVSGHRRDVARRHLGVRPRGSHPLRQPCPRAHVRGRGLPSCSTSRSSTPSTSRAASSSPSTSSSCARGELNAGDVECQFVRRDGSALWVLVRESALRGPDGSIVGIVHRLCRLLRPTLGRREPDQQPAPARRGTADRPDRQLGVGRRARRDRGSEGLYALYGLDPDSFPAVVRRLPRDRAPRRPGPRGRGRAVRPARRHRLRVRRAGPGLRRAAGCGPAVAARRTATPTAGWSACPAPTRTSPRPSSPRWRWRTRSPRTP